MNSCRSSSLAVVFLRMITGVEGNGPVVVLGVAEAAPRARGGGVAVPVMGGAPGGIALPDLYQAVADRPPAAFQRLSRDGDSLPQRFGCVLEGQVVVQLPYRVAPVR